MRYGGVVADDHYTPGQAARILGLTDRHVRHMLAGGELEGERTEAGRWRIPQREVHRLLEDRRRRSPGDDSTEAPGAAQEAAQEAAGLRLRVEDLTRQLGRLEGRLELTELAESTVQAERERLLEDLDRERQRAERLEQELEDARQRERDAARPWWRRMFGSGG